MPHPTLIEVLRNEVAGLRDSSAECEEENAALCERNKALEAFVADVRGYMERGDGRWYGPPMKARADALLDQDKAEEGKEGGTEAREGGQDGQPFE